MYKNTLMHPSLNEINSCVVVSVIIPTYNHQNYILKTLDSVFAQKFTDYEVIVVNDGSPDDTDAVLRPLVEAGKIRYIWQENAGQAAARNRGIAEAQGEFIALLDDDDVWPYDKLEWQVEVLRRNQKVALVYGLLKFINHAGEYFVPINRSDITALKQPSDDFEEVGYDTFIMDNPITSPGQCLIRRSELIKLGEKPFDTNIRGGADDWDLYLRLLKSSVFLFVAKPSLNYRLHSQNASNNRLQLNLSILAVQRKMWKTESDFVRRKAWHDGYNLVAMRVVEMALNKLCGDKNVSPGTTLWEGNILLIRFARFVPKSLYFKLRIVAGATRRRLKSAAKKRM